MDRGKEGSDRKRDSEILYAYMCQGERVKERDHTDTAKDLYSYRGGV